MGWWSERADAVCRELFKDGHYLPTKKEAFDAYPFGMREYTPYKVWLTQLKKWRRWTEARLAYDGDPRFFGVPPPDFDLRGRRAYTPLPGQTSLIP